MLQVIESSVALFLFITAACITLTWLFIKSAVKHGTKEAIMECYKQILEIENNPEKKEMYSKSMEQIHKDEVEKELQNW